MAEQIYQLPTDAVWFITGCSSGIGKALAQHIASKPAHRLVATARTPSTGLAFLPDSPNTLKLALDVTSRASLDAAVAAALERFGRLDVVVNNAGYALVGDTENAADADARRVLDTNFWGTVDLTKHAMRVLREDNGANGGQQGGVVVNVTSLGGRAAFPGNAFYHAAKFAVEGFTESVAKEVRPEWNVHFCLIEPGGVQTGFVKSGQKTIAPHPAYAAPDTPARVLDSYRENPEATKNWADPDVIAAAIYGVVGSGRVIPLRVPLGPDSWGVLKNANIKDGENLDSLKELAISAGKPGQLESVQEALSLQF
ncbi:short-chain dehydrogenase [Lasiosphaeris hirsuta]|uniref:Short-chain dehydrogenase n=1 Tax=Lasiosphaeris hirsuta TaxID=260670 RepID=A0AA40AGQ3_9PEZI|nr:short-chain dehydrogenase [Lasiosphaeris hirsuta]